MASLRRLCELLRNFASVSVGILFKMSSDFFQQTLPKFIYSGSCFARGSAPSCDRALYRMIERVPIGHEVNLQYGTCLILKIFAIIYKDGRVLFFELKITA